MTRSTEWHGGRRCPTKVCGATMEELLMWRILGAVCAGVAVFSDLKLYSLLTAVEEAFTRRSPMEGGLGLTTLGLKGRSLSSRAL